MIGASTGRDPGPRTAPINLTPATRKELVHLLVQPELHAVGYDEFLRRAIDTTWLEILEQRGWSPDTRDAISLVMSTLRESRPAQWIPSLP